MIRRPRPKSTDRPSVRATSSDAGIRLQKVLADAGIASRRQCEALISAGRVEVDGQTVTELGTRVDPQHQNISVDGRKLHEPERVIYLLHKPPGVVCTNRDPSQCMRAVDLVMDRRRLFTVGRLDKASEGLILLTNDGELANRLAHPRYGVEKTYRILVAGRCEPETVRRLTQGVRLAEGWVRAVRIHIRTVRKQSTLLEMVLKEGRNREIRRMLARVGHKVLRLTRVAVGPLRLGNLPSGAYRLLTSAETAALHRAVDEAKRGGVKQRKT